MRHTRTGTRFALALWLGVAAGCSRAAEADSDTGARSPVVTVYKSPTCGCCRNWVDHMRENGFTVEVVDRPDVAPVKREHGVPADFTSCHTALVEGYVVEGHVPAQVVRRLLAERPAVKGIAVPGMPTGSPGMEVPGGHVDPYEVYTFDETGPKDVYEIR